MKYFITIALFLNFYVSYAEERDINIYGTLLGYTCNIEFDMEYSLINTNLLGIETTTYLKFGASMFGAYDVVLSYSYPIVGFVQYFGSESGVDLGVNYFERYRLDLLDKSLPRSERLSSPETFEAIGFEIGYRWYSDNVIYRLSYTPSLIVTSNYLEINQFLHFVGFSMGYSF